MILLDVRSGYFPFLIFVRIFIFFYQIFHHVSGVCYVIVPWMHVFIFKGNFLKISTLMYSVNMVYSQQPGNHFHDRRGAGDILVFTAQWDSAARLDAYGDTIENSSWNSSPLPPPKKKMCPPQKNYEIWMYWTFF